MGMGAALLRYLALQDRRVAGVRAIRPLSASQPHGTPAWWTWRRGRTSRRPPGLREPRSVVAYRLADAGHDRGLGVGPRSGGASAALSREC